MLKLKIGQEIIHKNGGGKLYVGDIFTNSVLLVSNKELTGDHYIRSNTWILKYYDYTEPFEPEEGDCVWFLDGTVPTVVSGTFSKEKSYLFNRIFKTEQEAQEFCAKVNAL